MSAPHEIGPGKGDVRPALGFTQHGGVGDEVAIGRRELARAALAALDDMQDVGPRDAARRLMQEEYRARLSLDPALAQPRDSATGLLECRRLSLAAERRCLASLRRDERIGDAAFQVLEEELDWAEA